MLVHGYTALPHPLLIEQLKTLTAAAEREARLLAAPGPNRKLLAHIQDLMFDKIPQDPGRVQYRHGGAIPGGHLEWFRGKTGNGRYRLFYRYHSGLRIIIYAWINDEDTLRTYGAQPMSTRFSVGPHACQDPASAPKSCVEA